MLLEGGINRLFSLRKEIPLTIAVGLLSNIPLCLIWASHDVRKRYDNFVIETVKKEFKASMSLFYRVHSILGDDIFFSSLKESLIKCKISVDQNISDAEALSLFARLIISTLMLKYKRWRSFFINIGSAFCVAFGCTSYTTLARVFTRTFNTDPYTSIGLAITLPYLFLSSLFDLLPPSYAKRFSMESNWTLPFFFVTMKLMGYSTFNALSALPKINLLMNPICNAIDRGLHKTSFNQLMMETCVRYFSTLILPLMTNALVSQTVSFSSIVCLPKDVKALAEQAAEEEKKLYLPAQNIRSAISTPSDQSVGLNNDNDNQATSNVVRAVDTQSTFPLRNCFSAVFHSSLDYKKSLLGGVAATIGFFAYRFLNSKSNNLQQDMTEGNRLVHIPLRRTP